MQLIARNNNFAENLPQKLNHQMQLKKPTRNKQKKKKPKDDLPILQPKNTKKSQPIQNHQNKKKIKKN
jgi:hypothetical protein